jgi:hypothetical protein
VTPVRFANALAIGAVLTLTFTPDKKATMIKKLISLAIASASTLALAGCGATDTPTLDKTLMGDGSSNMTGLKGYWWTHVDRGGVSTVVPDTGKVTPKDAKSTQLKPGFAIGVGKGLEDDGTGNTAFHITGSVNIEPPYPPDPTIYTDDYWTQLYSSICTTDGCEEMVYPSVGLGFGFKDKNVVLGDDAHEGSDPTKPLTKGMSFRIKVGPNHAKTCVDPTDQVAKACPISVALPMDYTDVPDTSFGDLFGSKYVNATATLYPSQPADANLPICSFPGTLKADGTGKQGSQSKTCFCNMIADAAKNKPMTFSDQWVTYCAAWGDFGDPGWGGLRSAPVPTGGVTAVDPTHVIKMQFDAYKPKSNEALTPFDFWVDDVRILTEADWTKYCANAQIIQAK